MPSRCPSPPALESVKAKQLRALHEHVVSPKGAVLTLVGDLRPAAALDAVEAALGGWSGRNGKADCRSCPSTCRVG